MLDHLLIDDVIELVQAVGEILAEIAELIGIQDLHEFSTGLVVIGIGSFSGEWVIRSISIDSHGWLDGDSGIGLGSSI